MCKCGEPGVQPVLLLSHGAWAEFAFLALSQALLSWVSDVLFMMFTDEISQCQKSLKCVYFSVITVAILFFVDNIDLVSSLEATCPVSKYKTIALEWLFFSPKVPQTHSSALDFTTKQVQAAQHISQLSGATNPNNQIHSKRPNPNFSHLTVGIFKRNRGVSSIFYSQRADFDIRQIQRIEGNRGKNQKGWSCAVK